MCGQTMSFFNELNNYVQSFSITLRRSHLKGNFYLVYATRSLETRGADVIILTRSLHAEGWFI